MTRPRMTGGVESCIRLLVALTKVIPDTPMMASASPNSHALGMIAASAKPIPNIVAPRGKIPNRGLSRPAASSAPTSVPTAMTEVRNPY